MGTLICYRGRPTTNTTWTMTMTTMHKNNNKNNKNNKNMKKRLRLGLWSSMMIMVALLGLLMAPRSVKGQFSSSFEDGFLVDDAAVDAFAQIILENGGVFEGDVEIGENVTSLKGLEGLTSVDGYLWIEDNARLTSLTGLEALTSVGGYVYIYGNAQLTSLAGLEGLDSVGGWLYISLNDQLTSLAGLEGLTSVGGGLDMTVMLN